MEMLTIASLAYLPTSVIFVADLTEQCGTTAANQWKIRSCPASSCQVLGCAFQADGEYQMLSQATSCCRCELRGRFPDKPWVDVISKADLLVGLLGKADTLPGLREGEEVGTPIDLARAMRGALRVSSITGRTRGIRAS